MKAELEIIALSARDVITASGACLGKCGINDNAIGGGGGCPVEEDDVC